MHIILIIEALIVAVIVGTVREYWWMGIISFVCMIVFMFLYPILYSIGMGLIASIILWAILDYSESLGTLIVLAIAFGVSLILHLFLLETAKEGLD